MQTKVSYLSDLKFNLETWKRELRFNFNEIFKTELCWKKQPFLN